MLGRRDRLFMRLLMPPVLSVECVDNIVKILQLFRSEQRLLDWVRQQVWRRSALLDMEAAPSLREIVQAVSQQAMVASPGASGCSVDHRAQVAGFIRWMQE